MSLNTVDENTELAQLADEFRPATLVDFDGLSARPSAAPRRQSLAALQGKGLAKNRINMFEFSGKQAATAGSGHIHGQYAGKPMQRDGNKAGTAIAHAAQRLPLKLARGTASAGVVVDESESSDEEGPTLLPANNVVKDPSMSHVPCAIANTAPDLIAAVAQHETGIANEGKQGDSATDQMATSARSAEDETSCPNAPDVGVDSFDAMDIDDEAQAIPQATAVHKQVMPEVAPQKQLDPSESGRQLEQADTRTEAGQVDEKGATGEDLSVPVAAAAMLHGVTSVQEGTESSRSSTVDSREDEDDPSSVVESNVTVNSTTVELQTTPAAAATQRAEAGVTVQPTGAIPKACEAPVLPSDGADKGAVASPAAIRAVPSPVTEAHAIAVAVHQVCDGDGDDCEDMDMDDVGVAPVAVVSKAIVSPAAGTKAETALKKCGNSEKVAGATVHETIKHAEDVPATEAAGAMPSAAVPLHVPEESTGLSAKDMVYHQDATTNASITQPITLVTQGEPSASVVVVPPETIAALPGNVVQPAQQDGSTPDLEDQENAQQLTGQADDQVQLMTAGQTDFAADLSREAIHGAAAHALHDIQLVGCPEAPQSQLTDEPVQSRADGMVEHCNAASATTSRSDQEDLSRSNVALMDSKASIADNVRGVESEQTPLEAGGEHNCASAPRSLPHIDAAAEHDADFNLIGLGDAVAAQERLLAGRSTEPGALEAVSQDGEVADNQADNVPQPNAGASFGTSLPALVTADLPVAETEKFGSPIAVDSPDLLLMEEPNDLQLHIPACPATAQQLAGGGVDTPSTSHTCQSHGSDGDRDFENEVMGIQIDQSFALTPSASKPVAKMVSLEVTPLMVPRESSDQGSPAGSCWDSVMRAHASPVSQGQASFKPASRTVPRTAAGKSSRTPAVPSAGKRTVAATAPRAAPNCKTGTHRTGASSGLPAPGTVGRNRTLDKNGLFDRTTAQEADERSEGSKAQVTSSALRRTSSTGKTAAAVKSHGGAAVGPTPTTARPPSRARAGAAATPAATGRTVQRGGTAQALDNAALDTPLNGRPAVPPSRPPRLSMSPSVMLSQDLTLDDGAGATWLHSSVEFDSLIPGATPGQRPGTAASPMVVAQENNAGVAVHRVDDPDFAAKLASEVAMRQATEQELKAFKAMYDKQKDVHMDAEVKLRSQVAALEAELSKVRGAKENAEQVYHDVYSNKYRPLKDQAAELTAALNKANKDKMTADLQLRKLRLDAAASQTKMQELETNLQQAQAALLASQQEAQELQVKVDKSRDHKELMQRTQMLQQDLEAAQFKLEVQQKHHEKLLTESLSKDDRLTTLEVKYQESKKRFQALHSDHKELVMQHEKLKAELHKMKAEKVEMEAEREQLLAMCNDFMLQAEAKAGLV